MTRQQDSATAANVALFLTNVTFDAFRAPDYRTLLQRTSGDRRLPPTSHDRYYA